ncbi:MAG: DUF5610 domain-containing protein [Gammaproteobacteria bacterium]|nr:DUF5610 domain-containing protein [Gammaproteobacteria bacterium]MBD3775965.1 DUF5610 domain-containing protein [Thiotrichales bacterium]
MAIESIHNTAISAYRKERGVAPEHANPDNNGKRVHGQPDLPEQASERVNTAHEARSTLRQEQQASLIQHLFGNPETASQNALKITFQEAIDKLNEILSAELGNGDTPPISEETLQAQGGMEFWSPENTAKRIVDGSTAMLAAFQKANPNLQGEALITRFLDVIGNGISQGFDSARGILGDMNVLEDDIATNIDKTYELVQKGLEEFKASFLGTATTEEVAKLTTDNLVEAATNTTERPV